MPYQSVRKYTNLFFRTVETLLSHEQRRRRRRIHVSVRSRRLLVTVVLTVVALGLASSAVRAQALADRSASGADSTVRVMVLGSLHFANPEADQINPQVADVTTPDRQAQIQAVVDSLLNFRPTTIAVEWDRREAAQLDSLYQAYRAGRHKLSPNEIEQIGFRLAAQSKHERVQAVDHHDDAYPVDTVMAHAKEHDSGFIRYRKQYGRRLATQLDSLGQRPVGDMLRHLNQPDFIRTLYAPYMRMLGVGGGSTNVGVVPVLAYYRRNLHIFANLTAVTEPGDRVILILGAGHSAFLRQFVEGHPNMELADPLAHL